ncbi:hypothetical protein BJV82DRAFT_255644 [Fennellomyces sp. T-0311]|nr:hypothetical protein BJV82DRAFT_255644 [Fennellomyces sp. T-0311]
MKRFDNRNPNNPHSPTHRSPDLVPYTLAEIVEESFAGGHRLRNKFGLDNDENKANIPPGARFQDQRGPGIRPAQCYPRDNNNQAAEVPTIMYVGETMYESAESSVSSPMSSGKTPQFHEFEYARYGYNGDDDEANSEVTDSTINERQRTDVRSTLSSLNNYSERGGIWDGKRALTF